MILLASSDPEGSLACWCPREALGSSLLGNCSRDKVHSISSRNPEVWPRACPCVPLTTPGRRVFLPSLASCFLGEAAQTEGDQVGRGRWQYSDSCGEQDLDWGWGQAWEKGHKTSS